MNDFLTFLKQLSDLISWPVAVLIIAYLFRKQLHLAIKAITNRIETSQEIGIGKDGITLKGLAEKLKETEQKAEDAQKNLNSFIATGGAGDKEAFEQIRHQKEFKITIPTIEQVDQLHEPLPDNKPGITTDPNDPQKNKWGGIAKRNGRELKATVTPTPGTIPLYKIQLTVTSTSAFQPLSGKVKFHLHPSFPNHVQEVAVINGKAELQLISYGSFTVGAEADNGETTLELDLADIEGTTEHFQKT